ncbi:MAG: hypothetical protein R3F33_17240 [Planctomycetota bacterium]
MRLLVLILAIAALWYSFANRPAAVPVSHSGSATYDEALAAAKQDGKPILLDFYADW